MLSGSLWSFQKDFYDVDLHSKKWQRQSCEEWTKDLEGEAAYFPTSAYLGDGRVKWVLLSDRLFWKAAAVRHGIPKFWSE